MHTFRTDYQHENFGEHFFSIQNDIITEKERTRIYQVIVHRGKFDGRRVRMMLFFADFKKFPDLDVVTTLFNGVNRLNMRTNYTFL